jgi:hypothetical protein
LVSPRYCIKKKKIKVQIYHDLNNLEEPTRYPRLSIQISTLIKFPQLPQIFNHATTRMSPKTIFLLGATGFLGSQFLVLLARDHDLPPFHIVALLRAPTEEKVAKLKAIYADLSVVEGTLDDDAVIQKQAAKAGYTINCASSDHLESVVCRPIFPLCQ